MINVRLNNDASLNLRAPSFPCFFRNRLCSDFFFVFNIHGRNPYFATTGIPPFLSQSILNRRLLIAISAAIRSYLTMIIIGPVDITIWHPDIHLRAENHLNKTNPYSKGLSRTLHSFRWLHFTFLLDCSKSQPLFSVHACNIKLYPQPLSPKAFFT